MLKRSFIGAGLIGTGFAKAALGRGEAVTVWNRSPEKCNALEKLGAAVAPSLSEAAKAADLIHIALTSDAAVDAVLADMAEHLSDKSVVIDHSTNLPEGTAKRALWCAERSIHYLSAPIFMSPVACEEAKGLIVVTGPAPLYERCQEALAPMTGRVYYAGEETDRAAKLKLIGNGMILTLLSGLSDVFGMGKNMGLAPTEVFELFSHFDPSMALKGRGARMAKADFETLWSLQMARKDIDLMIQSSGPEAVPVLSAIAGRMDALIEEGEEGKDVGILARDAHR